MKVLHMYICIVVVIKTTRSNLDSGYDMISAPHCYIQPMPMGNGTDRKVFNPPAATLPCNIVNIKHGEAV